MPVSTEAHHTNVRLNPGFRQGENLARQALGGRRICCVLRCRAPVGANLVSKGKTLPYCSIFVRIPSEMAVLPEAHQQMSDLTHAFRKGANLARWALECCEAAAYGDAWGLRAQMMVSRSRTLPCCRIFDHIPSEMAVLTEAHQQMTDLTHASAWAGIWQDRR